IETNLHPQSYEKSSRWLRSVSPARRKQIHDGHESGCVARCASTESNHDMPDPRASGCAGTVPAKTGRMARPPPAPGAIVSDLESKPPAECAPDICPAS